MTKTAFPALQLSQTTLEDGTLPSAMVFPPGEAMTNFPIYQDWSRHINRVAGKLVSQRQSWCVPWVPFARLPLSSKLPPTDQDHSVFGQPPPPLEYMLRV